MTRDSEIGNLNPRSFGLATIRSESTFCKTTSQLSPYYVTEAERAGIIQWESSSRGGGVARR
jgi:hypothetical protein